MRGPKLRLRRPARLMTQHNALSCQRSTAKHERTGASRQRAAHPKASPGLARKRRGGRERGQGSPHGQGGRERRDP
eukprot:gene18457-biopygen20449